MRTTAAAADAARSQSLIAAFTLALLIGASAFLAGCNTMEGAGRDISAAGDTLTDTAQDVKR
jgi:predicted small secreted protein